MQTIKTLLFSLLCVILSPLNATRAFLQPNAAWLKAGASGRMPMGAVRGGGTESLTPHSFNDVSVPLDGVMRGTAGWRSGFDEGSRGNSSRPVC